MCQQALALLGPGLASTFFGLIGVVAARFEEGTGSLFEAEKDEAAWETHTRIELRMFRLLARPLLALGVLLVVFGVVLAFRC